VFQAIHSAKIGNLSNSQLRVRDRAVSTYRIGDVVNMRSGKTVAAINSKDSYTNRDDRKIDFPCNIETPAPMSPILEPVPSWVWQRNRPMTSAEVTDWARKGLQNGESGCEQGCAE
jgi:hypothetical protein